MIVVADASVLVAELIRVRGWALFRDEAISLFVAEEQWGETQYEIDRRLRHLRERVLVPEVQIASIRHEIQALIDDHAIEVVQHHAYGHLEAIARRRIPRDPNDWPTVALALALGASILTEDHDFLGCGIATWTFQTLRDEVAHDDAPKRFGFMLPNDDANLLPVTPQTADFLTKLGRSMLDPGPTAPDNPGDANIPAAYTYFGQFIDHDVTLETSSAGAEELLVTGLKPFDPEVIALLIANIRTGALDLDSVYGNPQRKDAADPNKLRLGTVTSCAPFCGVRPTHPDGVTEMDDFNDVNREPPHPIPSHDRAALIGDPRNDENLIVSQLHLAFLRAHNALVDAQNLSFDEARAALRRHYQFLVIHDFLKRVADPAIVDDILQNGSPTLTNGDLLYPPATKGNTDEFFMPLEYAVAAYRFGHSMIRARYRFNVNFPAATLDLLFTFTALSGQLGGGGIPEFDTLPENWIIQWEGLIDETTGNKARRIDTKLVDPLFELKNLKGEVLAPADVARLAVRNLLRGYLLRIPTGQAAATAMGITPLTPAQITAAIASAAQTQILQDAGFLTKTPLWFYILAEASAPKAIGGGDGNHLGAVGSTIVASVLIGAARRSEDSFLDEGAFPPGSDFEPTMPMSGATFQLADLLTFAGVFSATTTAGGLGQ